MKKLLITGTVVGLFVLPAEASPLFPTSISQVGIPSDDVVEVKKKWKHHKWSPGRKVGWRGRGMPPGQYKKYHRW